MKLLLVFLFFVCVSFAQSPTQRRTLVLLQDTISRTNYSHFFHQLEDEGFSLTFRAPDDPNVKLSQYGEYLYDNLILFANTLEFASSGVDINSIVQFLDDGNNFLLATDSQVSEFVRELAIECGVDIEHTGHQVIDHFNFDATNIDGDHTLIIAEDSIGVSVINGPTEFPILYRGTALKLSKDNSLVFPILRGSPTSYSFFPEEFVADQSNLLVGKETVLVSGLQARNNGRIVVSGSLELFSNRFFDSPVVKYLPEGTTKKINRSGNSEFVRTLTAWTFRERGVLRLTDVQYTRANVRDRPGFRIKDELAFQATVTEWNGKEWVPFLEGGLQIEFVRLDPYVRLTLNHDSKGRYFTNFTIPDVYGVYTLRLIHGNLGYSFVNWKETISVRPFRHDEYERFIVTAYPYYLSAFSMMLGFALFSFVFLYYRAPASSK